MTGFLKPVLWGLVILGSQLSFLPTMSYNKTDPPTQETYSNPRAQVLGRQGEGVTGFCLF